MTRSVTGATRVAAILGDPVEHSRSPAIWNAAFAATGLDWVFVAFPVPPGRIAAALDGVRALGIAAVTVTMPHKTQAAAACDELTATARALGAVNAIVRGDHGLTGDSTDGLGFVRSLADEGIDPAGRSCLVLGAGGAARAIVHALGGAGARVVVAARRPDAAGAAAALAPGARGVGFDALSGMLGEIDLVVNATPLGMQGEEPPFAVDGLRPDAFVADTVYRPVETPLLAAARARGLHCTGGLGMLVHQAAIAFERFTGVDPPVTIMAAAASP